MNKKYIKMNDMYSYLSLGNVILTIKNASKNKTSAIQSEVFCAIFDIEDVNETTVNNYCTGYRAIGNDYVQKYIELEAKYKKDKTVFKNIVKNILNIIEGIIFDGDINSSKRFKEVCLKLYNIAKNDINIGNEFSRSLYNMIQTSNLYEAFIEIILYAILENKQPIYEEETKRETIEIALRNTGISAKDLEKFLSLKLKEGINYLHSIKQLVKENNPYALFELAFMEYRGEITGKPRYNESYELFSKAARNNHPAANWMMANIIINKKIGTGNAEELKLAWNYLRQAEALGSVAAINTIGICYANGIGVAKDKERAKKYFEKAAKADYAYAYNNLGKYYEDSNDLKNALKYYVKSANLGESWAANKVGEMYRKGEGTKQDLFKAFEYYKISEDTSIKEIFWYSKYNLAKYFYLNGSVIADVPKNEEKAITLFEEASNNGIFEATEELIYIYVKRYNNNKENATLERIKDCIGKLEKNEKYNSKEAKKINETIKEIKEFGIIKP